MKSSRTFSCGRQSERCRTHQARAQKSRIANELIVAEDGQKALDYLFGSGAYADRDISICPPVYFSISNSPRLPGLEVLRRIRRTTI